MSILQAIILGIVQGLCEFLPISSSGHLTLFQTIFGIQEGTMFFDAMLHIGTLIAVFFYFRKTIWAMIRRPFSKFPMFVLLATIPTIIVTLLLNDKLEAILGGQFLGIGFLITATLLTISSVIPVGDKTIKTMTWFDAIVMGLMQSLAIFPGVSRSGSTISGGLFVGLNRNFAAEFSFMMSIPAILGSAVFSFAKLPKTGLGDTSVATIIIGTFCAMVAGFFAIRVMMNIIRKGKLTYFAIYCAILGILVLIDQYGTHLFFKA